MEIDKIYNEDCLETLAKMEDNSIDLIVTSPPYNKGLYWKDKKIGRRSSWEVAGIDYDSYQDSMSHDDYVDWQRNIISECIRVLKPRGSLFYNHKDILVWGGVLSVHLMSMISMYINRLYGIGGLHLCLIRTIFFQSPNTSIG